MAIQSLYIKWTVGLMMDPKTVIQFWVLQPLNPLVLWGALIQKRETTKSVLQAVYGSYLRGGYIGNMTSRSSYIHQDCHHTFQCDSWCGALQCLVLDGGGPANISHDIHFLEGFVRGRDIWTSSTTWSKSTMAKHSVMNQSNDPRANSLKGKQSSSIQEHNLLSLLQRKG